MKTFVSLALVLMLLAGAARSVGAMDSMHGSTMMPKCAAGDSVVGMNTMSKMYMTHDQMKSKVSGMSHSQMHAMMKKNHIKLMCMSSAKAMGAKMSSKMMDSQMMGSKM